MDFPEIKLEAIALLRQIVRNANAHAARNGFAEVEEGLIDQAEALLKREARGDARPRSPSRYAHSDRPGG
jgi:hypothetical protein